jgi:hypothetical protein
MMSMNWIVGSFKTKKQAHDFALKFIKTQFVVMRKFGKFVIQCNFNLK